MSENLFYMSLFIFLGPVACCLPKSNVYRIQEVPKMTPVLVNENEVMVWVDYEPSLNAFFQDIMQDLTTNKSIESYAYKNMSIIESIVIGGPEGPFGKSRTTWAVGKEAQIKIGKEIDVPVIMNNSNIIQPLEEFHHYNNYFYYYHHTEESRILANFNPCEQYENATITLIPKEEYKEYPWLVLVFDTFADEQCQDGTIPEEQVDSRIDLQECVLLLENEPEEDKKGGKLYCGNGQRIEMNIFMFMLMPSFFILRLL